GVGRRSAGLGSGRRAGRAGDLAVPRAGLRRATGRQVAQRAGRHPPHRPLGRRPPLRPRVRPYGEHLAAKSPSALAAIRRTVTLGGGMTFDDGLAYELKTVVKLAATPDFAEGVDAFLAKREPKWKTS